MILNEDSIRNIRKRIEALIIKNVKAETVEIWNDALKEALKCIPDPDVKEEQTK